MVSIAQPSPVLPVSVVTQLQAVFQRDPVADCIAIVWPNALEPAVVEQVVAGHNIRAVYCVSELAMREALVQHCKELQFESKRLVLLSGFVSSDLAMDVLARIWKNEPQRISPWRTLQQLVRVRGIDPRLNRKDSRWVADAMLNGFERYHEKISFGEVLDVETAWRAIAMAHLNYHEDSLDLLSVLSWSTKGDASLLIEELPNEVRNNLGDWLSRGLLSSSELVSTLLLNGQACNLLPIALACSVLFANEAEELSEINISQLHISRGIFRERYLNGKNIELRVLQELGETAVALVKRWSNTLSFNSYSRYLSGAEQILASLDMQIAAQNSQLLFCGLTASFKSFAYSIEQLLEARGSLESTESALRKIENHALAGLVPFKTRVERARMAARLLRWLQFKPATEGSATQLITDYIANGGFCDWARTELWGGDQDEPLSAAYQKLSCHIERHRELQNQSFGQQLSGIARGDQLPKRFIPVERALDDLIAPIAQQNQVLLLVLDGMSQAVYRQLSDDLMRNHWLELQPIDDQAEACLIAALPTVTQVSRCSLLSGTLCKGNADDEKRAFNNHPALKKISSTRFPPQVFHKQDLSQSGAGSLHSNVREMIAGTEHRVLAVVINAIDDQLSSSSQIKVDWSFETVSLLRHVMEAARESGRVTIITSDHGHVLDYDSFYQQASTDNGERYQLPTDDAPLSEFEVLLSGERVVNDNNKVIVPWSERLRYTRSKNYGYHGGGTLQEVVIPLGIYVNAATEKNFNGWREMPRKLPEWWHPLSTDNTEIPGLSSKIDVPVEPTVGKASTRKQAVSELVDDMFGFHETENSIPSNNEKDTSNKWVNTLLSSPIYQKSRDRAGRTAVSDEQIQELLNLMEQNHWQMMEATLCAELMMPVVRIRGFLAGAQKLLNVDGYPILSIDRNAQTIRLGIADLKKQFEIE